MGGVATHGLRRGLAAAAALAGALGGCSDGPDLVPSASNGLPREEYSLTALCPERSDLRGEQARRARARASREMQALIAAYRHDPWATIRISYTPADEPGMKTEVIDVGAVIRGNLDALKSSHCDAAARRRLAAALEG